MARRILREGRTRRWWMAGATLIAAVAFAVVFVSGSSANLAGSSFEGNDGNLVVNTAGNHDWDNAPNLSVGVDKPTGQTDNSFGQGTKEDNSAVTVVSGSIPNSKADLARFAVAGEVINGDTYMYLAWSRENQSGTVNFDFELNKLEQPDLTTPGPKTLNRSVNDLLINYAFQGGSNTPTLTKYHWNGSKWVNDGAISSTCSEGATNATQVSENLGGNPAVNRPAQQFGEAAINMACAGIVPNGACESFGSAYVKSRSSTSFTSEIKDFIAPVGISFSNCGALKISKTSIKGSALEGATFSITGPDSYSNSVTTGEDGTACVDGLAPGTYHVTETAAPDGYSIDDSTTHDVSVSSGACAHDPYDGASFEATDTPLTDITATVSSEAVGGTASNIHCVDGDGNEVGDSPDPDTGNAESAAVAANGLAPGTYTCTITVDP